MKFLLTALLLPLVASAATIDSGTVVCEGVNPHVNKATLTLTVDEKGAAQATMTYQAIPEDGETHPVDKSAFDPRDIFEASIGYQRANFVFAHHNTVVKLSADGDIFGGASESDDGRAPYNGVLFYQSGNGDASISRFQVVCRKVK